MTTSLSRGISSLRFFKLCSRAPPMRMKSLLMATNFVNQIIGKHRRESRVRKAQKPKIQLTSQEDRRTMRSYESQGHSLLLVGDGLRFLLPPVRCERLLSSAYLR